MVLLAKLAHAQGIGIGIGLPYQKGGGGVASSDVFFLKNDGGYLLKNDGGRFLLN